MLYVTFLISVSILSYMRGIYVGFDRGVKHSKGIRDW